MQRRRPAALIPILALTAMLGILLTMLWLAVARRF